MDWRRTSGGEEADYGFGDSLDFEVMSGDEVGVGGVFRFQKGFAVFEDQGFQGAFLIDQGGDDILVFWSGGAIQKNEIPIEKFPAGHRVTADSQGEGSSRSFDAEGPWIELKVFGVMWIRVVGVTGWDSTDQGDSRFCFLRQTQAPCEAGFVDDFAFFLKLADQFQGGVGASESEMPTDIAEGRCHRAVRLASAKVGKQEFLRVGSWPRHQVNICSPIESGDQV